MKMGPSHPSVGRTVYDGDENMVPGQQLLGMPAQLQQLGGVTVGVDLQQLSLNLPRDLLLNLRHHNCSQSSSFSASKNFTAICALALGLTGLTAVGMMTVPCPEQRRHSSPGPAGC